MCRRPKVSVIIRASFLIDREAGSVSDCVAISTLPVGCEHTIPRKIDPQTNQYYAGIIGLISRLFDYGATVVHPGTLPLSGLEPK